MREPGGNTRSNVLVIAGAKQLLTLAGPRGPRRRGEMRELGIVENGAVLVREACGVVTEPDGGDFMRTGAVLAANTALAPLLTQTLRGG